MVFSTRVSIGWIINGIDAKPIAVVIHGLRKNGLADLFCAKRTTAQSLLIVKPGIITDANPCQSKVSTVDKKIRLVLIGESSIY